MKTIGRDFGDVARKVYATASGTLPNGRPVVVNSNGTVSVIDNTSVTAVTFNDANSLDTSSVFDSNSNKVVVAYKDVGDSQHGYAIVGTVSGSSISFGTEVKFESAVVSGIGIGFDSNLNKVLIVYKDEGNSFYGTSIVGTVSGTSISFGTPVVYSSATTSSQTATFDSNSNKIVVAYTAGAKVGTISGTGISYGSAATFTSSAASRIAMCFDSNSNKLVVSFRPQSDDQGYTAVGTVSGTSISFGTAVKFNAATTSSINNTFDSNSNKVVVAYDNDGNSSYGTAIVGTVSGTSISFGSPVVFKTAESNVTQNGAFNTETNTVVLSFAGAGGALAFIEGTVSGTSISFGPEFLDSSVGAGNPVTVFDSNAKKTVASTAANPGKSVVYTPGSAPLTAENYIGMSSGGVEYDEGAASLGSAVVFEAAETVFISSTFDSANNRVVICYVDGGNSNYATAIVGTVSGTSISFGTPVVFLAARIFYNGVAFDSNSNKIVIAYRVASNGYGTAIVGTVSGTTISFGTSAVFQSATSSHAGVTFDSNSNKVVIAYNNNNQYGTAVVATVSGTNISFGTPVVYKSAYAAGGNDGSLFPVFDSNSNKVVIAYSDASNGNDGYAVVGTVSGTAISFGTAVTWGVESFYVSATFDSNSNKVVVAYRDADDSNKGKAIVGTVSGTTISFGSAVVFNAGATTNLRTVFDSNTNKVVITYQDAGNSDKSTLVEGEVSGTSISFGSELVFDAASSAYFASAFDSNSNKVVISYHNASDYGTAIVYKSGFDNTVRGQVASGGAALVNTKGAINTNQNALTAGQSYFVQTDGTITTTAGTPSVFAGTAVSATKLIVKG